MTHVPESIDVANDSMFAVATYNISRVIIFLIFPRNLTFSLNLKAKSPDS